MLLEKIQNLETSPRFENKYIYKVFKLDGSLLQIKQTWWHSNWGKQPKRYKELITFPSDNDFHLTCEYGYAI